MKYLGSKSRIAKHIVPIIQHYIDNSGYKIYIEPFCGGCNVIDKIKCHIKIASDKQHYLIEMFKNINRFNELPLEFVTREHYSDVRNSYNKNNKKYEDWYIGAIGFLSSFNGRFFDGGYAGIINKNGKVRIFYDECKRNLLKQSLLLKDLFFFNKDYTHWSLLKNAVIYCDPPYRGTKQYNSDRYFNHDVFWQWCREMSKDNIVLISEQNAPDDFKCIFKSDVTRTVGPSSKMRKTEKLFKFRN